MPLVTTPAQAIPGVRPISHAANDTMVMTDAPTTLGRMLRHMIALGHQPKILDAIVSLVAIDVVDHLISREWPSKVLLHHESVFIDLRMRAEAHDAIAA